MMQTFTASPPAFSIAEALTALAEGREVAFPNMETAALPGGLTVHLNMERDPIQNRLRQGVFYEAEDLKILSQYLPPDSEVIDIGANIGNHTMWFLTEGRAAKVWPVEPNPLALAPLMANILRNGLWDKIRPDGLGFGLADKSAGNFGMKRHERNLGATKMWEGKGDLPVARGDDLLAEARPDLIKIDVEGMEMAVLAGLETTIRTHQPVMMIEVLDTELSAFEGWCETHSYDRVHTSRVSAGNANYIVLPKARRTTDEG